MSLDLQLSQEQLLLRATVRDVCERFSGPDSVRELEDDPIGYRPDMWRAMTELGLNATMTRDELSMLDLAVVYEEFGRALCWTPHLVSSVLAAGLVHREGSAALRDRWLPALRSGASTLTCAWLEPRASMDIGGVRLAAQTSDAAAVLSGVKIMVPFAAAADGLLTLARSGSGVTLYLVERDNPRVSLRQEATLASDCSYRVTYDEVRVSREARIGPEGAGWALWEEAMTDVLILVAAYATGGATRANEMATDYAKVRVQFDKPIGSFQGVAHPLAEMAMEIEGARVLAYEAAWARAQGRDARTLAAMAKLYACDVFRRTTKVAQQVFGGIGFIRDIDIQLYYRRAKQLESTWWGPAELEERIAAAELDTDTPFVTTAGRG